MNFRLIFYVVGNFLKYFGFLMLIPAVISLIHGDNELFAFILTSFATTTTGYILEIITKKAAVLKEIKRQEGFLIAALCWVLACLFGSLPYLLLSVFSHPVDAIFESFSGFTTTGATVLSEIESLPHGILFYRSFTQWLGGMGIIILAIAILPRLSVGGMHYTLGILILSSYKKPLEVFRLPLIYATIIGLVISAVEYEIPITIGRSIELLGDISIPAMMFALGYKLSELKLTKIWLSFLFGSMRIFLGFFLGIFFVRLFRLEGISAMVMILQSSMPPAVFNFVLAEKYKKDSETVASIIMAGTIVSLITIPLILTYLLDF